MKCPMAPSFPKEMGHTWERDLTQVSSQQGARTQPTCASRDRRVSTHVARALLFHHHHCTESYHFSKGVTRSASSIRTVYSINTVGSGAATGRGCVLGEKQAWDLCDQKV